MTVVQNATFVAATMHCLAGRYLTFSVEEQSFALAASRLRDIYWLRDFTAPGRSMDLTRGIVTFNGRQAPVLDFRPESSAPAAGTEDRARVVVVESCRVGTSFLMALIIDRPCQVVTFGPAHIQPVETVDSTSNASAEFLLGKARRDGVTTSLIDIDHMAEVVVKAVIGLPGSGKVQQIPSEAPGHLRSVTFN